MRFETNNPEMKTVLRQSLKLAKTNYPVIIVGEKGTGRKTLAEHIHKSSPQANGPFVRVNCSSLDEDTLFETIFGTPTNPGQLHFASTGTLVIAEAEHLTLPTQVNLAQYIDSGAFLVSGGRQSHSADTRLIFTTTRDLLEAAHQGSFSEDLYFRVNIGRLTLPPLRQRKEDIQHLTEQILSKNAKAGAPPKLTAEVMAAILLYDWPGNLLELETALKRALIVSESKDLITLTDLPPGVAGHLQPPPPRPILRRYVRSAELLLIRWVLSATQGDRTRAARFLGVSRAALYKKLKLYPEFTDLFPNNEPL